MTTEYILPFAWWLLTSTDLQAQLTMTLLLIESVFMGAPLYMMHLEKGRQS